MKFIENNKIYFKSVYNDFNIINENLTTYIINSLKNRENKTIFIDQDLNKLNSYDFINNIKYVSKGFDNLNLNKGDKIGIILPNIIEFTYCLLGSILSGGIVSPINSNSKVEEIKNTLSKILPKYLIINYLNYKRIKDSILYLFPNCENIIIIPDNDDFNIDFNDYEKEINFKIKFINFNKFILNNGNYNLNNSIVNAKDDIAVILYSSGTTGNYKGVCLTHENLYSNINQVINSDFKLKNNFENDKILTCLPMFHIFGLTIPFLSCIAYGCCVHFIKRYSLKNLLTLIENQKISFLYTVPSIIIELSKSNIIYQYNVSSLNSIFTGGATFPNDLNILKNRFNNLKIRQGYGLTECSPCALSNSIDPAINSVGLLVPNMIAKVVDINNSNLNLNVNEIGELCFKGPNLMKYYYNNTIATKESIDNEGFLLSGDIGYIDDNGYIFIIDRKKEIIKSNGYQVSPSEIESILLSHSKIEEACIIGVPSKESNGENIKAYIVLKDNQTLTKNEIHKWLNPKISSYKSLNGGIEFVDKLPKSSSGKILRRVLKDINLKSKL